ncbi:hypothetical protein LUX39_33070 [Actinomadura madurae]|nr:hypothetical protein [Actinomadura madurae]MCQ0018026.1 hypothetical protein [Actinomadura madurae]
MLVEQVRQAEHQGAERQRHPRAGALLEDPEQHAAVHHLLGHGGGGHEAEQRERAPGRAEAVGLVAAEEGDVDDDGREQPGAEQRPQAEADRGALGRHLRRSRCSVRRTTHAYTGRMSAMVTAPMPRLRGAFQSAAIIT